MVEFHLAAIVKHRKRFILVRLPVDRSVMQQLVDFWIRGYEIFVDDLNQIDYRLGLKLKESQCFRLNGYRLPNWISNYNSTNAISIDEMDRNKETYDSIQGTVVFTTNKLGEEILLFRDFAKSNVINP